MSASPNSADLEAQINARRATQRCPGSGKPPLSVQQGQDPDTIGPEAVCRSCQQIRPVVDGAMADHNRGPVYLTRFGRPLRDAIQPGAQLPLFADGDGDGACDSGYCWT